MPNIQLKLLRTLDVHQPTQAGRPAFVAAASGLVIKDHHIHVIADDELSMATFPLREESPGQFFSLFDGTLPLEKKERKKLKPDLESLCLVEIESYPHGALLALPSGSKANRTLGALIVLTEKNLPEKVQLLDFSDLYNGLPFQELNLEGALVQNQNLIVFQRGNSKHLENSVLILDLEQFLRELKSTQKITSKVLLEIRNLELGQHNQSSLSFTDATPFKENQILYLASTEETDNPYEDGPFQGAVIGLMDSQFQIQWQIPLAIDSKPEGISWWAQKDSILIVTDSDDASIPACLYEAHLT